MMVTASQVSFLWSSAQCQEGLLYNKLIIQVINAEYDIHIQDFNSLRFFKISEEKTICNMRKCIHRVHIC